MRSVLAVAGLDPSGGAGIIADVRTIRALGFFPSSVVTVITFQNTCGVKGIREIDAECVERQISAVLEDLRLAGIKIGLVCSERSAKVIAKAVGNLNVPKVVDPVIKATTGFEFSGESVYSVLAEVCDVITPNADEASRLSGIPVRDVRSAENAAKVISETFGCSVVITGGSLGGRDVVFDAGRTFVVEGEVTGSEIHGTGCVYSSALTCYLAMGLKLYDACKKARKFVHRAVIDSVEVGRCLRVAGV